MEHQMRLMAATMDRVHEALSRPTGASPVEAEWHAAIRAEQAVAEGERSLATSYAEQRYWDGVLAALRSIPHRVETERSWV